MTGLAGSGGVRPGSLGAGSLGVGATRRLVKHPRESLLLAVDFRALLGDGELISGPLEVQAEPAGLELGTPTILPAGVADPLGGTLPAGCGVQFRVAGGVAPAEHRLTCVVGTTRGNTRVTVCRLLLRAE